MTLIRFSIVLQRFTGRGSCRETSLWGSKRSGESAVVCLYGFWLVVWWRQTRVNKWTLPGHSPPFGRSFFHSPRQGGLCGSCQWASWHMRRSGDLVFFPPHPQKAEGFYRAGFALAEGICAILSSFPGVGGWEVGCKSCITCPVAEEHGLPNSQWITFFLWQSLSTSPLTTVLIWWYWVWTSFGSKNELVLVVRLFIYSPAVFLSWYLLKETCILYSTVQYSDTYIYIYIHLCGYIYIYICISWCSDAEIWNT